MSLEIEPFVSSLNIALEELAGVTATTKAPEFMKGNELLSEISIVINLEGFPETTIFMLTCNASTAQKLTTLITGKEDVDAESYIVRDTLAEILNILVGAAQKHSNLPYSFSLPLQIGANNEKVSSIFDAKYKLSVSFFNGGELSLYMLTDAITQELSSVVS